MRAEKKAERLAALFGLEAPKPPTKQETERATNVSREAEATIAYFTAPTGFTNRLCRICEREFAVNRANISCCSDTCRRELLAELGISDWDPTLRTVEDRWNSRTGGPEPLVCPPEAVERVNLLRLSSDEQAV